MMGNLSKAVLMYRLSCRFRLSVRLLLLIFSYFTNITVINSKVFWFVKIDFFSTFVIQVGISLIALAVLLLDTHPKTEYNNLTSPQKGLYPMNLNQTNQPTNQKQKKFWRQIFRKNLGKFEKCVKESLEQWFSTFLMLWPFNTVPHVVVTPNHKIIFVATS